MDKTSTQELCLNDSLIEQALKKKKYPAPSASSLEFLKNFARNFKSLAGVEGEAKDFVLN